MYPNCIKRLDLSFNSISDLAGVEAFSSLEELVLDNNCLEDGFEFPQLQTIHGLTLNKNMITDLDWLLDTLASATPNLTYLSLLGNKACPNMLSSQDKDEDDYQRYRYYVLYRLPKLKFLDSKVVQARERKEAQTRGSFQKIVRPETSESLSSHIPDESATPSPNSPYTPLSENTKAHKATFGKCQYVYYGKHSEGNRFIRNKDL